MKTTINKALQGVKRIGNDMMAPTPPKDRARRNGSIVIGILGLGLKAGIAFYPDVFPEGIASLASELFYIGLGGLGLAGFFQSRTVKK